jgi:O-antigen/teichoic acid export membrane protein
MSDRLADGIQSLRGHTARGTVLNSGYQISLSALGLIQRLVAAAFLTKTDFGLWAVILTLMVNMGWLKSLGIVDKYLQQSEPDQERAFQKAFTLELFSSLGFVALCAVALPLWALAYGHQEIIVAGLITAATVPLNALQAPAWIPYRRLEYGRQRLLTGVAPVTNFVVTVGAAVAGAGYWSFVAGAVAGSVLGGAVCVVTSPYELRIRYDRATTRSYVSFSWPLAAAGLSGLVFVQGSLLVVNHTLGLAAVGAIGLVVGVISFAERVDTVVSQTIYPAVCAVADKREVLKEVFLKSNRVALMWAMPFAVALALFAGDLITFVLGDKWSEAHDLLVVTGLSVGLAQLAFNWVLFMRALNRTRPILVAAALNTVVFLAVLVPATAAYGLIGYGVAFAAGTLVQVALRGFFMSRLFDDLGFITHALRAVAPTIPATLAVLLVRSIGGNGRSLNRALIELAVYAAVSALSTYALERQLVRELAGYLIQGGKPPGLRETAA